MDNPNVQQQSQAQSQTPQTPTANDVEAIIDPKTGKLVGKYNSFAELGKGYWNAVEEMNATKDKLAQAMSYIERMAAPGATPQQPSSRPDYAQRLETLGIPTEDLGRFVEDRAAQIAEKRMAEQLSPIFAGMQARQYMMQQYPDFAEIEPKAMELLNKSPELKARFEGLLQRNQPTEAFELAYFYQKQYGTPTVNPEREAQRRGAGFPEGTGSANRPASAQGAQRQPTAQEIANAQEIMDTTKDPGPLMQLLYGNVPLTWSEQMNARFNERQG